MFTSKVADPGRMEKGLGGLTRNVLLTVWKSGGPELPLRWNGDLGKNVKSQRAHDLSAKKCSSEPGVSPSDTTGPLH